MADLKVRGLDERVARALKSRASKRGVSLEEEVRTTLTASVSARRESFRRRAAALRADTVKPKVAGRDSARIIRAERDASG
jgi:plasmid stability protein